MIQFLFPVNNQQVFSVFIALGFFCYLCQIYGYLAFLLPPQRGAHLTVVDQ